MALPNFLTTNFRYLQLAAVADVQTIIDNLCTELTAAALGWTITAGGVGVTPTTLRSPVIAGDLATCFFSITLTRTLATRLNIQIYDCYGVRINNANPGNAAVLDVSGGACNLFTGQNHVVIDSVYGGVYETFYAAIIDPYPETKGVPFPYFICSQGPRRADTGALYNQDRRYVYNMSPNEAGYVAGSMKLAEYGIITNVVVHETISNKWRLIPQEVLGNGTGAFANAWLGRIPHCMVVDANNFLDGTDISVLVDTGVTGTFRVVGIDPLNNGKIAFTKSIV